MTTVHSALAQGLVDAGVEHVFGVLGHGNLAVVNDLCSRHPTEYVAMNREDAAVSAADAYARVSGRLGVATVTHGPGLTNTITSLHEAAGARTPLLVLVGDTDPGAGFHEQDIDQRSTVAPTGAAFRSIHNPLTALSDLATAIQEARHERRPVVLNMPVNIQNEVLPREASVPAVATVSNGDEPDQAALDVALGVLAVARRPVVLAGQGAATVDSRDELVSLAGLLNAPLATTLLARGLFDGQPFDLGVHGTLSSPLATEVLGAADCLLAFGASLNRYTTAHGALVTGKSVIQVDHDAASIGRWSPVTAGVVGDAGVTASNIATWYRSLGQAPVGLADASLRESLAATTDAFTDASTATTIDPRTLMTRLDHILPRDRAVVTDVGGFLRTALRYLPTTWPQRVVVPGNYGSIGLGVGSAIGAAVADRTRPVVVVVGDGGFMMGGLAELDTAVRHGLDLVVVVINNGGYDLERIALRDHGGNSRLADMNWPAFAPVAQSMGARGITVGRLDDLAEMEAAISAREGPLLIDARVGSSV